MNRPDDFLDEALRASLAEHARHAPDSDRVADRIIVAARMRPTVEPAGRRRGWRSWSPPLVAAGAAAAVGATVIGIASYHPDAHTPIASPSAPVTRSHSVTTTPTATVTNSPTQPLSTAASPADTSTLHGVRILDLTFGGVDDGWALASANCIRGTGRCTALLRTTDGQTWRSMPGARFNVDGVRNCADPCVQHLRFATDRIGYAYGADALFMTTDGGASWQRQRGRGAEALETANGNVIRLASEYEHIGCSGPCNVRVAIAAIGSTRWKTVHIASHQLSGGRVQLVRHGANATVLVSYGGPAGARPRTEIYTSRDDGRSWAGQPDPCTTLGWGVAGPRVGALEAAQATDGSLTLLCTANANDRKELLLTSTDHGGTFRAGSALSFAPASYFLVLGALSRNVLFTADATVLRRSVDGGRRWQPVATFGAFVVFLGFESPTVGRAVPNGGRSIWTTRDAGRTWSEVSFG